MSSQLIFPLHKKINISPGLVKSIANEVDQLTTKYAKYPHYLVNGKVTIIPLISLEGKTSNLHGFSSGENFYETKYLKNSPCIKSFIDSLPGKKFSCRISTLNGQSEIYPHRDYFRSLEFGVVRLHLPLKTSKDISFNFDTKKYNLEVGYLHYVDISQVHYLSNPTNKERVHLIIDLEVTIELLKIFQLSKFENKLRYLNHNITYQDIKFKKLKVVIDVHKLPFPLSTSKSNTFEITQVDNNYYFKGEVFDYDVIKTDRNIFYLPSLGPGFYFYYHKNKLIFYCHGIVTLTPNGLVSLTRKSIWNIEKKMIKYIYKTPSVVEGETVNKDIYLFNLEGNDSFAILTPLALKIWSKLKMPKEINKYHKTCKIIYKNNNYLKVIKKLKDLGFLKEYLFYN
jgi:hypothetical protein